MANEDRKRVLREAEATYALSEVDRKGALVLALREAEAKYGVTVVAVLQPEVMNPGGMLVRAVLALDLVAGWKPKE